MKSFKRAYARRLLTVGLFGLAAIPLVAASSCDPATSSNATNNPTSNNTTSAAATPKPTAVVVATRKVTGTTKTLGAGTFTAGKDVADGLYVVTTGAGENGNFMVNGTDSYNEILGASSYGGVPKIRVQISTGDQIVISGLSTVTFTPVSSAFVTTHKTTTIYAGTFLVGQDVGAGRYVATPGAGQSGNFMVGGADSYNEILGGSSAYGGVPSVSVSLTNGDVISISSLSQVTLTATN